MNFSEIFVSQRMLCPSNIKLFTKRKESLYLEFNDGRVEEIATISFSDNQDERNIGAEEDSTSVIESLLNELFYLMSQIPFVSAIFENHDHERNGGGID